MYDDPWKDAREAIEGCERFVSNFDGSADQKDRLRTIASNAAGMESQLRTAGTPMAADLADRCRSLQSNIRRLL